MPYLVRGDEKIFIHEIDCQPAIDNGETVIGYDSIFPETVDLNLVTRTEFIHYFGVEEHTAEILARSDAVREY
jgi:hypothetical protein